MFTIRAIDAAAAGFAAHVLFFVRNEPRTDYVVFPFLAAICAVIPYSFYSSGLSVADAYLETARISGAFFGTLTTSILVYRYFFHPLGKYPGPKLARLSRFWNVRKLQGGKFHELVQQLHRQHGPVVRIGPNELSFSEAEAIPVVLGNVGKLNRGPWYDTYIGGDGTPGILVCRDPVEHARLRKIWDKAMSPSAILTYRRVLSDRADHLVSVVIDKSQGGTTPVNLSDIIAWASADTMGDLGFGGFSLLADGEDKLGLWTILEEATAATNYIGQIPWLTPLLDYMPQPAPIKTFLAVAGAAIKIRQTKPNDSDILHYLLGEDVGESPMKSWDQLMSNCFTLILAAADTVTTTLNVTLYHLLSEPKYLSRLQAELDEAFPNNEPIVYEPLVDLPFLNACISEALRILPPVPSATQRSVGIGGIQIAGRYIPAGTTVGVPPYTIQRDATYFSPAPEVFLPERWLPDHPLPAPYASDPFVHDLTAYFPFSLGPHLCAGKAFAQLEARLTLAKIVKGLDLKFSERFSHEEYARETRDIFLVTRGTLWVDVKARE